jgi:hypothetical protein
MAVGNSGLIGFIASQQRHPPCQTAEGPIPLVDRLPPRVSAKRSGFSALPKLWPCGGEDAADAAFFRSIRTGAAPNQQNTPALPPWSWRSWHHREGVWLVRIK